MANRLQHEISPYLLQHADNPVDWYPWGPEAFALAREQDKPVFLSVGYAACHWCHVMAHESFENPEIAAIMNEYFVNIKVDREERPDVDSLYMDAVVSITGQGGWPMSVFLSPDGKPFFGGTYFPPVRRHNLPSFPDVLHQVAREWKENREHLLATGMQLVKHIASTPALLPGDERLDPAGLDKAAEALLRSYDWTNGGWGGAPKFPQATTVEVLLQRHHRHGDKFALNMATHALDQMARGGIYDHLGGGFHRYAVDDRWLVPHFEKMLYDNALMVQAYLHTWQVTGNKTYHRLVVETLDFLLREMRHPEGGFYSALDADSEGEEGKYYVWKLDDIYEAVADPELADLFVSAHGASDIGNFEAQNVLFRPIDDVELGERYQAPVEEVRQRLAEARSLLLAKREKRIRPAVDDKVLTAWNGLILTSLAETARATGNEKYLDAAQTLATFMLEEMVVNGQLKRSWRAGDVRYIAYLEDHAALGLGLLTLYQVDFNPRWYQAAIGCAEEILAHFTDPQGGFFDTRDDHEALIARPKSLQDSPTPSGNTLAVTLLLRLTALAGEGRYLEPAESALRAMQGLAARHPTAFAGWLSNIDFSLGPQLQLALVGSPDDHGFRALYQTTARRYLPRLVIAGAAPDSEAAPLLMDGRQMIDGKASAYLCQGFSCNLPTTSPETLLEQIEEAVSPNNP